MKLSAQDESVISQVWGKDLSLVEIWKSYQRTHLQETVPWHQAIDEYLEHLASNKRSRGYVNSMRWVLKEMGRCMGTRLPVCAHSTQKVQSILNRFENADHKRSRLSSFYNWAFKKRYLCEPVLLDTERRRSSDHQIGTLSNTEVAALLQGCSDELIGYLWLSLGLGLRVAEANRVQELECRDGCLIVGAGASKTRTRRIIDLLPGHVPYWDSVRPVRYVRGQMARLRSKAGIITWPRNCMRHTAASHWLNFYQDEAKAALHLGHSPTMLHRHYKALVTGKESEEFFALWEQAR